MAHVPGSTPAATRPWGVGHGTGHGTGRRAIRREARGPGTLKQRSRPAP